jgi:hypothetical protein
MDGQIMNKSIGAMLVWVPLRGNVNQHALAHHPLDARYDLVLDEPQLKLIIKP